MTKANKKIRNASDKYVGVFPFQFDQEGSDEAGDVAIPDTIHLIPIGQWEHDLYGPIIIANSDIREFAQNFNAGIRKGVPITAGHEGMAELPAVGWIKEVEVRDDGLWGTVEWNENGEDMLEDKQYKFFSPEFYPMYEDPETHQLYRNVLTGGALTKAPYFKELEAIVFSEPKIKKQFNSNNTTMTLQELLAKKVEELSVEEKAFIKEHVSELTDEQKTALATVIDEPKAETAEEKTAREAKEKEEADAKTAADAKAVADANVAAGLNEDGSAKVAGSEKIMVSATELAMLRSKADEGAKAFAELQAAKVTESVKGLLFSETNKAGKFLPKSKDTLRAFMETLNDAQKAKFTSLLAELPKTQIFSEAGVNATAVEGTVKAEVEAKVKAKMSEDKTMKYSDALKQVFGENKGLNERYDAEISVKEVA